MTTTTTTNELNSGSLETFQHHDWLIFHFLVSSERCPDLLGVARLPPPQIHSTYLHITHLTTSLSASGSESVWGPCVIWVETSLACCGTRKVWDRERKLSRLPKSLQFPRTPWLSTPQTSLQMVEPHWTAVFAKLIVYCIFIAVSKYVLLAPFVVLIMTWCKQLLLIGLFLMSLFSFLQYEGCIKDVFIRLWELVRECFLAVAGETWISAGYVAKAIWLAVLSEPNKQKKFPLFKRGWKRTWTFPQCL